MLFTTAAFFCLYLPTTLGIFFALGRWRPTAAIPWLFLASLVFYGVWMPLYVSLLLSSIVGNFLVGRLISSARSLGRGSVSKGWMIGGILANLVLLGYFKYANFFVENVNAVLGSHWAAPHVLLPIGISFFTFTQIAFLADCHQKGVQEPRFAQYGLFVSYFPHLIAGPVLHHAQMMPQFRDPATVRPQAKHLTTGLTLFALGLIKKVVFADGLSPYADAIFNAADAGSVPQLAEAWLGAAAYTLQIYYDFSGYSDMAIGLSLLFNIELPINFDSPYQARNISDFWRRWHTSLSGFLRDYLYIALGGNRRGPVRRYLNLAATMLIGGLWHGASWSFVFWGGLHGLYLMINHGWRALCGAWWSRPGRPGPLARGLSWGLTLLCVIVAWVFFRANSLGGALRVLQAMTHGHSEGPARLLWDAGLPAGRGWLWCGVLGAWALWAPNNRWLAPRLLSWVSAHPQARTVLATVALSASALLVLLNTARDAVSAFIYFNF